MTGWWIALCHLQYAGLGIDHPSEPSSISWIKSGGSAFPWQLTTNIPVFAIALRLGQSPTRRWLIYAHSPLVSRQGVTVTVPGFRDVRIDVPRQGRFYIVREGDDRSVKPIGVDRPEVSARRETIAPPRINPPPDCGHNSGLGIRPVSAELDWFDGWR